MTLLYLPSAFSRAQECLTKDCEQDSDLWASRIAPYSTLSGKVTQPASWRRAWKKAQWMRLLFGPMYAPSMQQLGMAAWISSLPGSHARICQSRGEESALMVSEADCSLKSLESQPIAVRSASFWRTSQASLLPPPPLWTKPKALLKKGRPPVSWENWPISGGIRNGSLYPRPMWVPVMVAPAGSASRGAWDRWDTPDSMPEMPNTGSNRKAQPAGLGNQARVIAKWATPDCNTSTYSNGKMGPNIREQASQWMTPNVPNGGRSVSVELVASKGMTENGEKKTVGLESQVKHWPTPKASELSRGVCNSEANRNSPSLQQVSATWPTPAARDFKGAGSEGGLTRMDGKSRMDQLANAAVYLHLGQTLQDGQESSPIPLGLPQHSALSKSKMPKLLSQRLNPYFVEWLMGWPQNWTLATVRPASSVVETESFRSALQQHLLFLLGEPEFSKD